MTGTAIGIAPGIAPECIPRLTERFYCVDQPRLRELAGTGLGLAIVKHVLARHRCELEAGVDVRSPVSPGRRLQAGRGP